MFRKKKDKGEAAAPAKAEAAAPAAEGEAAPKKRSKVKLAVMVLAPLLVLGGGGYGGWVFFLAPKHAPAAEAAGEHGDGHGADAQDDTETASISPEQVAAENSFTYSFALSQLVKADCGDVDVTALKTESDKEAAADGKLVSLSWQAALARKATITDKSCNRILFEIDGANTRALTANAPKKDAGHH